ncbi:UDP-Glycosyltransferase/glycogen phosphorylase [Gigaspora margarita]|uniref:UDP-Glycosyltransferase/glycogen phosphorylase n=1 Tax=Gigaspora margarita TaxID=4874 RepID=A0A8H3XHN8_GIGMA|nr:UDP-Glycosyltransferase/glycogen phosphorylase [Gigaspora margarita]KAF0478012.1 UDP-Glycosyltransferase/glycogen phosphorylase [Gigaspora margarita]
MITLVAPGNYTAKSSFYSSIPQVIVDVLIASNLQEIKDLIDGEDNLKTFKLFNDWSRIHYVTFYEAYKQVAEEIDVDLFICEHAINYPCFDLAWKLGKPVVGISPSYRVFYPPYRSDPTYGCHVNMENEPFYDRFICATIAPLRLIWITIAMMYDINIERAKVGIESHWDPRGRISNILMLFNYFFGVEVPSIESPLHQEIGPILPDTFPDLSPENDSFLINHPRTLYFALGTNVYIAPHKSFALLKSFLKLIDQNVIDGVIWASMRTNTSDLLSFNDFDVHISDILNNNHSHIHVTKHAPQFAILSHENTKLFLSHGGMSSVHESIYTGTPMLILPSFVDQLENAEKLELAGVALKLSKFNINVDDIILKAKRLLNEKSFKINAERLQFLAKVNSKRKHRGADLIEVVMNRAKYESENGESKIIMKIY